MTLKKIHRCEIDVSEDLATDRDIRFVCDVCETIWKQNIWMVVGRKQIKTGIWPFTRLATVTDLKNVTDTWDGSWVKCATGDW